MTQYNTQAIGQEMRFQLNAPTEIIPQANDYSVCIEKFIFPNSNKYRPIDFVMKPYGINIEYDDKDIPHPNLVYGPNFFEVTGPIYSIQEFIDKVNVILDKASMLPLRYDLGKIVLEYQNGTIALKWEAKEADYEKWLPFKLFFDYRLTTLFNFRFMWNDPENFVHNGEDFIRVHPVKSTIEQESYSADLFYQISSLVVYTDLPIGPHYVSNSSSTGTSLTNAMIEIYYNTSQLMDTTSVLYIPETPVKSSLESYGSVSNISLWCAWRYTDGREIAAMIDKGRSAKLTLLFEKN
jgi:hypothetical protein